MGQQRCQKVFTKFSKYNAWPARKKLKPNQNYKAILPLFVEAASVTMWDSMCLESALQYHTDNTDGLVLQA